MSISERQTSQFYHFLWAGQWYVKQVFGPFKTEDDALARLKEKMMGEPILQYFEYNHLPDNLREISKHFHDLAHTISVVLPRNPEKSVALRKLLEAKDAAVRARLDLAQSAGEVNRSFSPKGE